MMKSGWGRALRYFVWQAEIYVCYAVAGAFVMVAYVNLINGEVFHLQRFRQAVPNTVVFIAMMILFLDGASSSKYLYDMPVSFGCLRRNAFLGGLLMDGLLAAESLLISIAGARLLQTEQMDLIFCAALLLLLEGIARLIGIASMKWGRVAYFVMIVVIVGISVCIGFLAGATGGVTVSLVRFFGTDWKQKAQWVALATGAVVCFAANAGSWGILKNLEVRI